MAKYIKQQNQISKEEREKLLIAFCKSIVEIKNPQEAAFFIQDLLSKQESLMLSKRLAIAARLIVGESYIEIKNSLMVSTNTIARVNAWLGESGQGYRTVLKRINTKPVVKNDKLQAWHTKKRGINMHNWPQELAKEIILTSNKRQQAKILRILNKVDSKCELYKDLNQYFMK